MRDLWDIIWQRFNVILSVVGDVNARAIAVVFYFTVFVPFGIGSTLLSDPLRRKTVTDAAGKKRHIGMEWLDREPVPTDIDAARQQG